MKCVCCENETNGSYNKKFPVCYNCYFDGTLQNIFYGLVNRHAMNPTFNQYAEQVIIAAKEWKENFYET